MNDSVIASMQVAIRGLSDERTKLNQAFEQLSQTIKLLDSEVESVADDGTLHYGNGRAVSAPGAVVKVGGPAKVPPGPPPQTAERAEHGSNLQIVRDAFAVGEWYSISAIAFSTGLSKQRVSESVRRLVEDRYLVAIGQPGTQDRQYALVGTPEPQTEGPPAPTPVAVAPPKLAPKPKPPADKRRDGGGEWTPGGDVSRVYFGDPTKIVREKKHTSAGKDVTLPHWTERAQVVLAEQRVRKVFDYIVSQSPEPVYARGIGEALNMSHAQVGTDVRALTERGLIVEYRNYGYYEDPGPNGGGRPSHAYSVNVGAVFIDRDGNKDPSPALVTVPPKAPTKQASPKS